MKNILCIGQDMRNLTRNLQNIDARFIYIQSYQEIIEHLQEKSFMIDLILYNLHNNTADDFMRLRHYMLEKAGLESIPVVTLSSGPSLPLVRISAKFKSNDHYLYPLMTRALINRIKNLLHKSKNTESGTSALRTQTIQKWGVPFWKRSIDILGSGLIILLLSPLLLLTIILIRLESRGPVFYNSKRAGQGFKVFNFYKFRSMYINADAWVAELKKNSQYIPEVSAKSNGVNKEEEEEAMLVKDDGYITEAIYQSKREVEGNNVFFKMENDPRITRVGRFIRMTSIDELPQLFNVLKGDMSLVGNRPLPLYEAEKLTSDEWVLRFSAPAGITGLWQVSKRGHKKMSAEERKQLDVFYAQNYSFWLDMKILLKTLPASVQRANV